MLANVMHPNRCMITSMCVINHATVKVVVELRAQLCALLEVWVLGVGMSTLGPNVSVRRGSGTPKYR
jgi:hypothetical protein